MNYDFSNFHPTCAERTLFLGDDGVHVCCITCGVSANLEAISAKISPADACKVGKVARTAVGKQSPGVDRGGLVE